MLTIKNINKYLLLVLSINDFKILRKPKLIHPMTKVTESGGRQNIYSIEPRPQVDPNYVGYPEVPRKLMVDGQCLALLLYLVLMQQQVKSFQVSCNEQRN